MSKKTPIYSEHVKAGAKIVDFHGWELPMWYSSITQEHNIVRNSVGIFDVSHMGEILVEGTQAQDFVDYLITNGVYKINNGQIVYSSMCNEKGGIVDDLLAYKYSTEKILLVVNASNIEKDYEWIKKISESYDVKVTNMSDNYAQIAFQGPKAQELMQRITDIELDTIGFYEFKEGKVNNIECLLSRTGYTGEDGFEIYLKPNDAPAMWQKLVELAEEVGGSPAGLGCRDTLRFEAVYMLYGNELNDNSTPLEAGIKWSVDFNKDFMGKDSLVKQKEEGLKVMLRGVEILDKMPVRHEYEVYSGEQKIGYITSGAKSPSTGKNLALAYIEKPFSKIGANIQIKARNKMLDAVLIKKPFYRGSVKNS